MDRVIRRREKKREQMEANIKMCLRVHLGNGHPRHRGVKVQLHDGDVMCNSITGNRDGAGDSEGSADITL